MANRERAGLLFLLLVAFAAGDWKYIQYRHEKALSAYAAQKAAAAVIRDGQPIADEASVPDSVSAPPSSPWLTNRTRRYASLFKNWHCDLLVVPMQVEEAGFDRPNRQIMTADLALALSGSAPCVADPYLVDAALGDGLRRRDSTAVLDLARTIKANRIVAAYAGHDEAGKMRVTLQLTQLDPANSSTAPKLIAARSFNDLRYIAEHPPFAEFHDHLPQMLAALGLAAPAAPMVPAGDMPAVLPASLDEFKSAVEQSPVAQAARLEFLGTLAPQDWRATDRLFSKAWIALEGSDSANPAVRLLRARALLHLQERPYALAQLADTPGAAADGLRAVLNGNLPEAREALKLAQSPWDTLFLGLEVHDLELSYEREPRHSAEQVLQQFKGSPWQVLATLRLGDRDTWGVSSTVWLKLLLDQSFPIADFSLSNAGLAQAMLAVFDRPDAEMSTLRHLYRLEQEQPQLWCCASFSANPRASDLLDLLDSRTEFTLGRQVYYLYSPQGAYDRALKVLQRYDDVLAGSPCAEHTRAWIYRALMNQGELGKHDELNRLLHQSARLTAWWDQGQTSDSNNMLWYLYQAPVDPAAEYLIKYTDDYPVHWYWDGQGHVPLVEQRLAFSTDSPKALSELIKSSTGDKRSAYLAILDSRFRGGPASTQLRMDNLPQDIKTPEYLRKQIAGDPDNYRYYSTLGHLLLDKNAFAEASLVMQSFPLYREEHPNDNVALSNHASSWGHALFWLGAVQEARPLFRIAAGYDNGSAASVNSAARLELLDRNYGAAAMGFLESARHYNGLKDYREFLDLTFASGLDTPAWALFDRLQTQYDAPDLWESAMIGNRKAGLGGTASRDWVNARLARLPSGANRDDVVSYALLEEFMDRQSPPDFADHIRSLAGAAQVIRRPNGDIVSSNGGSGQSEVLGPSLFGHERHAKAGPANNIPNRFTALAEALSAERAGRYDDAVAAFDRLSAYYKIEDGSLSLGLPYFAYAAAKTGDTLGLQSYVDGIPDDKANYDVQLARAVFLALAGRHDAALAKLDKAFQYWPYAASIRDLTSAYDYLDTCTTLFETTHDPRYRQAALRLARALRQIEPARAYAHALVAYLSDQESEQTEALAMAIYLDPQSRWASMAPAETQSKARQWTRRHSLFPADSSWLAVAQQAAAE